MSAPQDESNNVEEQEQPDPENNGDEQNPEPDEAPKEDENALPDWARNKLTKANNEAASYRTQLREAQAMLAKAKSPEEFEAAVAEFNERLAETELNAAKATAALKYNLPDTLVARLQGSTPEELEADAKALSELVQTAPKNERLRGGLNPAGNTEPEKYDPKKLASEVSKGYGLRWA